jgi:hypothetical protein
MRPGLSHSLIGLLTTVVNVATAQNGNLSLTAKVTVAVTAAVGGSMLGLSVLYGQLLDNLVRMTVVWIARLLFDRGTGASLSGFTALVQLASRNIARRVSRSFMLL